MVFFSIKTFLPILSIVRGVKLTHMIMLKSKSHANALREVTLKNKKEMKSTRYPPGQIYLCVLGNGSISSSRCLYMFTDHGKYIFNCGEGTQRLAQEHKMKLSRLEHVFITHNSWDNLAGLLGLSLTIEGMGVPEVSIHGPSNLDLLYDHASSFVFLQNLKINTKSYKNKTFRDDVMEVEYIPIFKPSIETARHSEESQSSDSESSEEFQRNPKRVCIGEDGRDMTVAYACKCHNKPGFLMIEKCVEMGVPPGPLLGELKNGRDVTLTSGRIVYSKDVVSADQICPLFLVVECPSEDFLDSFVNEPKFFEFQKDAMDTSKIAAVVVHFTSSEIMKSSEYQMWMSRFPSSTSHIAINSSNPTLNSIAVHRIQHKLNLLHPGIFKLLHEQEVLSEAKNESCCENVIQPNTLDCFHLRPSNGFDRSNNIIIQPECYINEAMSTENFEESLKALRNNIETCENASKNDKCFPEITFFGTGSSIPSKARNVSGILSKISNDNYIILDCGEGTYHQLIRVFGKDHKHVLLNTSCVFISHMHADHHLGLIRLLKSRKKLFEELHLEYKKLTLVGPRKLKSWLKTFDSPLEKITSLYRFIECSSLQYNLSVECEDELKILENYNKINLATVAVNHCSDAYGVVLKPLSSEWKLVYSGDTTPCHNLVTAGQNCSVLIHEATMEDELAAEAVIKKHSTTSEAIMMGKEMNSKYTILTHFSQRYAKIPLFNENFHNHIGCAFDNMTVSFNELYILPMLIPTLKCLFAEDIDDMNTKSNKRQQKQKVLQSMLQESLMKSQEKL